MASIMSAVRARASNPVIDTEFAERLSHGSTANFDIHESMADVYAGANPKFITDLYSGLVWYLDNQVIANNLKQIALKLPAPAATGKFTTTIDSESELRNELETLWESENSSYDNGYDGSGPLHLIMHALNVRQAWVDNAQVASTAQNRLYTVPSIGTTIGMPRRQVIGSDYMANASVDALTEYGLISDQPARLQFSHGCNWLREIASITASTKANNPTLTPEQQQGLIEADEKYIELIGKLGGCSEQVTNALEYYDKVLTDRQEVLNKWYQNDLDRIPVMMKVHDFCNTKMLVHAEDLTAFHDLPRQIQVGACNWAINTLTKATATFRDKPMYLYAGYKKLTAAAVVLLNRVIKEQLAD